MKLFYCPVCGKESIIRAYQCKRCNSNIQFVEEKYDVSYYEEQSINKCGNTSLSYDILRDTEISCNPYFNPELSKKLFMVEKERRKAEQEEREIKSLIQQNLSREAERRGDPKCPICGSYDIKRISGLRRAAHAYAFGLFSNTAKSQFECLHCKYKF